MTDPTDAKKDETEKLPDTADAKKELFEAIDHFRSAAAILFERAAKDPAVKATAAEAERVVTKIGQSAEPLARQLAADLSKLTKTIAETIDPKKHSSPPPKPEGDDEAK